MSRSIEPKPGRWLAALFLFLVVMLARADDTNDIEALTKDLGISLWDESFSIRNGVGYDDNVLLDNSRVRGSGFFDNGVDATVFRLPLGAWQYYFFMTGDDVRYWRNVGTGSEDNWLSAVKIERELGDFWLAGGAASYAYQDQVFDLLTFEDVPASAPTKVVGNTFAFRPFLRRSLGSNYWVELGAEAVRQLYTSPAFSYWRAGPKITLAREYGFHSELNFSYGVFDQPFDKEPRAALDGSNLPGPRLAYLTQKVELFWRHHFGESRVWENTVHFNFDSISDNGSGYYSYYRYGATEQFGYDAHGWTISAESSFQYYDYPHQTAADLELNTLYETGFSVNLHVERQLTNCLKLFADYEFRHTFSNDSIEQYAVNTVKGGLQWEF